MNKEIPASVLEYGLDFSWSEEAVWKLDYQAEDIAIEELEWHFKIPFWDWNNKDYSLTPNQVLNAPDKYQEQY